MKDSEAKPPDTFACTVILPIKLNSVRRQQNIDYVFKIQKDACSTEQSDVCDWNYYAIAPGMGFL